jgi:mRNA-degrading endonuclease YafQ of YafQ-DinJ toxin-antitoxin module
MPAFKSPGFDRDYKKLGRILQQQVDKTIANLLDNPRLPGLNRERVKGSKEAWSCRVTRAVRIIYRLRDPKTIELLLVGPHDVAYREGAYYWLRLRPAEEQIPASELEDFQMFTPSSNGMQEDLKGIDELVRAAQVPGDAQHIADLLRRLISNTVGEGTAGHAAAGNLQDVGGPINVIPAEGEGECRQVLLAFCLDRDNFGDRLQKVAYHAGIHCPDTKLVVIVTSQWKPTEWKKNHEKAFEDLNANVVIFLAAFGRLIRMA